MKPQYLRLAGIGLIILLIIALGIIWIPDTTAHKAVADFQPTLSAEQAARRVATAQAAEEELRLAWTQQIADVSQLPAMQTVYFPLTGHHLSNRSGFLDFWRANGQVQVFGYPITEEIIENDRVVQYFERARFEYHPELVGTPWEVQLGLLGYETLQGPMQDLQGYMVSPFAADPYNGSRYFTETGHTIVGIFRYAWEQRGGLDVFGYPITEQFVDPATGQLVQYFERARMEQNLANNSYYAGSGYHTLYEVQFGDLGRQMAQVNGVDTSAVTQLENTAHWSPALWQRRIEINLSTQWLTAYEGDVMVYNAPVATGRDGFNTPAGQYAVYDKLSIQTMNGSAGGEVWNVPDVPWVMYVVGGVAIHGTYWHNAFGTGARPSHGCINTNIYDAQWLWEWADIGTPVTIHY